MPYLDSEEKFYDYRTKEFDGKNPFDERKTGVSFYNQFFTDPDYMEEYKNLKHSIVQMTPKEYFEECAKIFNSTINNQINQTKADKQNIAHLKEVLLKWKKTFPITFLNYAEDTQEGRHRMYAVGELLGWDKKFPVMIIDWADKEKQEEEKRAQLQNKRDGIISFIDEIVNNLSTFNYDSIDELIEDFEYYLNSKFSNIQISYSRDSINFNVESIEYKMPIWKFNINSQIDNFEDEDYDYDQMIQDLKNAGLKNW